MSDKKKENPNFIHGNDDRPENWEATGINSGKIGEDHYFWASPSHKGDKLWGWVKSNKK